MGEYRCPTCLPLTSTASLSHLYLSEQVRTRPHHSSNFKIVTRTAYIYTRLIPVFYHISIFFSTFSFLLISRVKSISLFYRRPPLNMASFFCSPHFLSFLFVISLFHVGYAARKLNELVQQQPLLLEYHNGPLLSGKISINLIWYGKFKPSQRAIVSDFITSLSSSSSSPSQDQPSVSTWWKTTEKYYHLTSKNPSSLALSLGKQVFDEDYSLGQSLFGKQIVELASRGEQINAINVVLTSSDVAVDGFCSSRCGTHGSSLSSKNVQVKGKSYKFAYLWVGNSETQCPGQCAWPFHQPIYGPQSPPLVAPNNDVGVDGMIINLASLLAGTATNPFGNGYFQGPAEAPLEAASACPGVYGKGAYPGYAGDLLLDSVTGASYNAHGANGRKYLLPALYDPSTSSCSTLV